MEFKKIHLNGFKSFADKTNFLIEDGLTGIVGPNGCGKSNIVESLRWVMGETSAKSMRGSGMEDVIFSGTSNKPSKNIAEVSVQLVNEKNEGPIQFRELNEINIRRKIELGVIDENIVASELQAVLREIKDTRGITSLDKIIRSLSEGKFALNDEFAANVGQKLSNFGKTATRVYAGGDNLWKWYGHEYVKSQLRGVYSNIDDISKWYREIVGRDFNPVNTFTGKRTIAI